MGKEPSFFSWPMMDSEAGKALIEYEQALVAGGDRQRTLQLRDRLWFEIVKLLCSVEPKPVWLDAELKRLKKAQGGLNA